MVERHSKELMIYVERHSVPAELKLEFELEVEPTLALALELALQLEAAATRASATQMEPKGEREGGEMQIRAAACWPSGKAAAAAESSAVSLAGRPAGRPPVSRRRSAD